MARGGLDVKCRKWQRPSNGKKKEDKCAINDDTCERFGDYNNENIVLTCEGLGCHADYCIVEESQSYNKYGACKDLLDGYCNCTECMRCHDIDEILFKSKYFAQLCNLEDYTAKYQVSVSEEQHRYKCKYYQTEKCKYTNCMCCPIMEEIVRRVLIFEQVRCEIFNTGDRYEPTRCYGCGYDDCNIYCSLLSRFKNELIKRNGEQR